MKQHEVNTARFVWHLYRQLRRELKFTRAEAYEWLKRRGFVPPRAVK